MTVNEAIQEFEDEAYHHSLHPAISDEAKAKALQALREKAARENTEQLTNADRIRAMSDEALEVLLCAEGWKGSEYSECLEWLRADCWC